MNGWPNDLAGAILNLIDHDVKYRLNADTKTFEFVKKGLPEWLADHLAYCRRGYTAAVRFEKGLCVACGADSPKHPAKNKVWLPMWCTSCYAKGAWEARILGTAMKGGPKGRAKSKAEDDGMFAGIGDDDENAVPVSLFDGES